MGALTVICRRIKYVFLRRLWGQEPKDYAWGLFGAVLVCGVVPIRLLSDRESSFHEQVMLELTALLTSRQGWGLAGAPQGHGDVERVHREVHKDLGRAVESVASCVCVCVCVRVMVRA